MTKLEKICLWKKMELDPTSSTFYDVKRTNSKNYIHPLAKCIDCNGNNVECYSYRPYITNIHDN